MGTRSTFTYGTAPTWIAGPRDTLRRGQGGSPQGAVEYAGVKVQKPRSLGLIGYKSIYQSPGGCDAGKCGVFQQGSLAAKAARLHVTCYVFIQFYSGFKRQGDLQHNIEMQAQAFGVHLLCISIDLCLAERHSDLTCDKTKGFCMDRMKKGQIVGVRGGPRSAACAIIWSSARAARAERDCPCSTLNCLKWGTNRHPRYIPVLMKLVFIYNGYCWCSIISRY